MVQAVYADQRGLVLVKVVLFTLIDHGIPPPYSLFYLPYFLSTQHVMVVGVLTL